MHQENDDLWFVELPGGRTRAMTLEELDAAYQKGEIDEATRVRKDGEVEWSTLAVVAGLDEDVDLDVDADAFAETVLAPPSVGPSSLSPYAISTSTPPPSTPTPPLSLGLGLDDDDIGYGAMQKSNKPLVAGLLGAVALAVGVTVFTVARAHGGGVVVQALPAAAAQASPPPAAANPSPPPAAQTPAQKLTDDQKKALSALDKKHETESARKAKERAEKAAAQHVRRTRGRASEPFVKGTGKFDPLNGNL
jgi:hypothetical protein